MNGFGHAVASAEKLAFTGAAQELYKQVVIKRTWLHDRDLAGGTDDGPRLPWEDSSPNTSPQTSPQKAPVVSTVEPSSTISSPSKVGKYY
ncbi:hypothetical protein QZH41_015100 [Actinostola sp. cb2023]|nr:hypothetical protein QZH41_015100 [Actinostola sp. cb2023]